jgi:hypothetical protein
LGFSPVKNKVRTIKEIQNEAKTDLFSYSMIDLSSNAVK